MTLFVVRIDGVPFVCWSLPSALASLAFVRLDPYVSRVTLKRLVFA